MTPKTTDRATVRAALVQCPTPGTGNALHADSCVLTLDGALPAQYLAPGDRVITRDAGMAVLTAIRHSHTRGQAVAMLAATLGATRPERDVVLPADQEVLIRDWRAQVLFGCKRALVPARRLIDGVFVRGLGEIEMTVIELIFDRPHILYVDGLELASSSPATTLVRE